MVRTTALVLASALLLAGCATYGSADKLSRIPPQERIESAKSPRAFALCASASLVGANPLANDGEHYWFLRVSGDVPYARWDFYPRAGGSYAEVHSDQLGGSGKDKVRACA